MAHTTHFVRPMGVSGQGVMPTPQAQPTQEPQHTEGGFTETMKEAGTAVVEKAKEAACSVGHAAEEFASEVSRKAGQAKEAVASGMHSVADTVQSGGQYIREAGVSGMVDDMGTLIRKHPFAALCVGFGLGFLISRAVRGVDWSCNGMDMEQMAKASNRSR